MSDSSSEDAGLKAIITCCVLAAALVVAIIIAWLLDKWYDKRKRRNTDDISDNMNELIQSRLSVIRFKRNSRKNKQTRVERSFFSRWRRLAGGHRENRDQVLKENRQAIGIENTNGGQNSVKPSGDGVYMNGAPRTPRMSIFAGGNAPAPQGKREVSSVTVNDLNRTLVSPVAKGQPVSSIIHQIQQPPAGAGMTTINEEPKSFGKKSKGQENSAPVENKLNREKTAGKLSKREQTEGRISVREKTEGVLTRQKTNTEKSKT